MRTKEEVIKSAWGKNYEEFKEHIDENGWAIYPHFQKHEMVEDVRPLEFKENGSGFRPKSLSGLEDNNRWIKIESEEDLPKELTECFLYDDDGDILSSVLGLDYPSLGLDYKNEFERFKEEGITHYQPIIKPKPPLY